MRTRVRDSEPSLRGEIEYLLQHREPDFERGEAVGTAWTAKALADELGATTREVNRELVALNKEGKLTFRLHRSGEKLWKLKDRLHDAWQEFAGPGARQGVA